MVALIERAQFARNDRIYDRDGFKDLLHTQDFQGSWLEWFLLETERMHGGSLYCKQPEIVLILIHTLLAIHTAKVRRFERRVSEPQLVM